MARPPSVMQDRLTTLLRWLGYEGQLGWVTAAELGKLRRHRHSLSQAFNKLGIVGAFGLTRQHPEAGFDYTPFVYVGVAEDETEAKAIHRAVWSQGSVPFLLILTPTALFRCKGMSFSSSEWPLHAKYIPWQGAIIPSDALKPLDALKAVRIRSSVSWKDADFDLSGRVDVRLLKNLRALSDALIKGHRGLPKLEPSVANALIGRFLYLFFLVDRKIISQEWIDREGHSAIRLLDRDAVWEPREFWRLIDTIDIIFNGSVFDISVKDRKGILAGHISLVRSALKHDGLISSQGVQTSFIDFDLATLQTETLSAVYEQFFENQGKAKKVADGAFYTPPYLVDYVLDRVEDEQPLSDKSKILDCAAGSGVFLVGAFRRLIELRAANRDQNSVSPKELEKILRGQIFGIECNSDAAHVAAFSLYLTMLDYMTPSERELRKARLGRKKIFPSLIGSNILAQDLFSTKKKPKNFPHRFSTVVGNPPWQKIHSIGKLAQERYSDPKRSLEQRIDEGRADQLFFWTAVEDLLANDGVFGLLLSAKSLISSSADKFPRTLFSDVAVTGIANFSHLRRKLFPGAEHPAVAIFGRRRTVGHSRTWIYYPLLSSLPTARDKAPWCIIQDSAEVEFHPADRLTDPDRLFQSMMLRPIDREIADYLADLCQSGQAMSLGDFCESLGLEFKRGGSPQQTGISAKYLLGVDTKKENYFRASLGLEGGDLFGGNRRYELPAAILKKVHPSHRSQFSGCIVAIPRSMASVDFVEQPFGFNSGLNSINWVRTGKALEDNQVELLRAITRYLQSNFANYLFTLIGRMWFLDSRRLEVEDLRKLPLPVAPNDPFKLIEVMKGGSAKVERAILSRFDFPTEYSATAIEYGQFWEKFKNGKMPDEAHQRPSTLDAYTDALVNRVKRFISAPWSAAARVSSIDDRGLGVVTVKFVNESMPVQADEVSQAFLMSQYDRTAGNVICDSSHMHYDKARREISLIKPLFQTHWTVERAHTDGLAICRTIFRDARGAA